MPNDTQYTPANRRSRVANAVILGIIAVIAPVFALLWFVIQGGMPNFSQAALPQIPPADTIETLTLLPGEPATTAEVYSDSLTVVVEGTIALTSNVYRDIAYQFTDERGLALDPPIALPAMLYANDAAVEIETGYSAFHVYRVTIDLEDAAAPVTFELNVLTDTAEGDIQIFIVADS